MHLLELVVIAFVLSLDSFATAIAIGISRQGIDRYQTLRLSSAFLTAHILMVLVGYLLGRTLVSLVDDIDHWVAFCLLTIIGVRFIYDGIKSGEEEPESRSDPTKGKMLLLLSLATSIDALVLGGTFAALEVNIIIALVLIGLSVFFMTYLGTKFYKVLGKRVAKYSDILGGIVLIGLGIKILLEHAGLI